MKKENWEKWEEKYEPTPNHIDKRGTYYADEMELITLLKLMVRN